MDYFMYCVFVEFYGVWKTRKQVGGTSSGSGHTNDLPTSEGVPNRRGERPNDPDLPVRHCCRDLPPGLVGGGSWKSDDGVRRKSDGVVSGQEREFVYLDYFMYGVFVELYGV